MRRLLLVVAASTLASVAGESSAQPADDGAVAVSGYGVTLRPARPYELGRAGDAGVVPDALILARKLDDGVQNAIINPGRKSGRGKLSRRRQGSTWVHAQGKDGLSIALGTGIKELTGILDARPGPTRRSWTIEAGPYQLAWPTGFILSSVGPRSRWPFELSLAGEPDDAMIFLRGPMPADRAPTGDQLVGPDQNPGRHWDPRRGALGRAHLHLRRQALAPAALRRAVRRRHRHPGDVPGTCSAGARAGTCLRGGRRLAGASVSTNS